MDSRPLGGRYQIIRQLGAGGFSRTFLVKDLHLPSNPRCVIKQLKPQTKDPDALDMARRLFDTEARVLYKLGSHLQIPSLLAHFEDKQEFYLAQEFIEGTRLSREFVKGVSWPETRVTLLLQEVLKILSFVHEQQVIHRDVKPSNLIRRFQDGRIVLIDFGAVKQVSSSQPVEPDTEATKLTVAIGTQGYMPNEQYAGKPRFSSDIYAVGMLAIRALTGRHPKKIEENPISGELDWQQYAPNVSPSLAAVIDRMVRYDFRDRYPTAVEALDALNGIPDLRRHSYYPISKPVSTGAGTTASVITEPLPDISVEESTRTFLFTAETPTEVDSGALPTAIDQTSSEISGLKVPGRKRWLVGGGAVFGAAITLLLVSLPLPLLLTQRREFRPVTPLIAVQLPPIPPQLLSVLSPEELAEFYVDQGNTLRTTGQSELALAAYNRALTSKRDYAPAYLGQCRSFLNLDRPDDAIVACNDALAYESYLPEAVRSKGNALEQQGRLLEALRLYEEANRQSPALAAAWFDRGRVLQQLGRSAEAVQSIDRGIERDRNSPEAWTIRGEANMVLGRYSQAIVDLDKALLLKPDYAPAVELRRQLRQEFGR